MQSIPGGEFKAFCVGFMTANIYKYREYLTFAQKYLEKDDRFAILGLDNDRRYPHKSIYRHCFLRKRIVNYYSTV